MSRCSSAIHSPGRKPVAAANSTSGPKRGPSSAASAFSSSQDSNSRFSVRRRCGLSIPCFAGFTSIIPQLTARASTCRSACVASKRCPVGMVIRHAAISAGRSLLIRRWPNTRTAFASSQRSFSTVSGSPPCWARYTSTSSLNLGASTRPRSRRSRSSARSRASVAARSDSNPPRWIRREPRPPRRCRYAQRIASPSCDFCGNTCPCCVTAITSGLLCEAMVYVRPVVLRCTRRALNLLDGHRSLAKLPPSDDDWCLNLLWLDRGKCLLLTHAGTLFSVFVANVRAAGLRPIAAYAVGAIEAELRPEVLPEGFQNCSLSGCLWWSALGGSADAPLLRLSRVLGCSAVACPKPEQRVRQIHRVARAPTSARRAQPAELPPAPAARRPCLRRGARPLAPSPAPTGLVVTPHTLLSWHRETRASEVDAAEPESRPPRLSTIVRDSSPCASHARTHGRAPRIAGELQKLGLRVSPSTACPASPTPPSPSASRRGAGRGSWKAVH